MDKEGKNRVFMRLRFALHVKDALHQGCEIALKVVPESLSLGESAMSEPKMVYKMFKGRKLVVQA